jgi:Phosphotransferase enzyme family
MVTAAAPIRATVPAVPDWTEPWWLGEAHAWIRERASELDVQLTGAIEQPHVRPWSTVMRLPTSDGDLWFKANHATLTYEAAVVQTLTQVRPDLVPGLVAVDRERGWMLMRDGGERLREVIARERALDRWLDVLPLYAELQIEAALRAEELVALGVPDLRLATLPAAYAQLLDESESLVSKDRDRLVDRLSDVETMCDALAAVGIPETIQHNDLHDGQVFILDGRYLVFDWGDSCISHPFSTMSVTLEGVLSWGLDDIQGSLDTTPFRDAYLEPFTRYAIRAELETGQEIALRLGWICRAVNTRVLALGLDSGPREDLLGRVRVHLQMFLDGTPS